MKLLLVTLFLIGNTCAEEWSISWDRTLLTVHMDEIISVPFFVTIPKDPKSKSVELSVKNSDPEIARVDKWILHLEDNEEDVFNSSVNITGILMGTSRINLVLTNEEDSYITEDLQVTVIRAHRLVDTLFTASVAILVSILYINFGCAMDWSVCRDTLRKPVAVGIGAFCQFIIMPLLSYFIGYFLFPDKPEMQIGIFFTGISPSGGASNIWTVLLGGNLNLSVTMTTLGTIASFATIPIWIFSLGKRIFDKGNLTVPYSNIGSLAIGLVIPLGLGYLIQKKAPKLCRILVRIMKPFSVILIIFIIIFAIVTNLYLFKLFSWQIIVSGMGLPWLGFICGYIAMIIFKQPKFDTIAIAIETGIQNTGIAIFLLRFSLTQPAADLTSVIPVACAIMTPLPLTVIWIIKLLCNRRSKKRAASNEKLQKIGEPITSISTSNATTLLQ